MFKLDAATALVQRVTQEYFCTFLFDETSHKGKVLVIE